MRKNDRQSVHRMICCNYNKIADCKSGQHFPEKKKKSAVNSGRIEKEGKKASIEQKRHSKREGGEPS